LIEALGKGGNVPKNLNLLLLKSWNKSVSVNFTLLGLVANTSLYEDRASSNGYRKDAAATGKASSKLLPYLSQSWAAGA